MSNAAVINATNTSGLTAGSPLTIDAGGDVVLKAFGSGSGAWSATLAFAPYVNGAIGSPITLSISSENPSARTSTVTTSDTQWVGWVTSHAGTWEASGIVEGYQPDEALANDLGVFVDGAEPTKALKEGASYRTTSGSAVVWRDGAGWVATSSEMAAVALNRRIVDGLLDASVLICSDSTATGQSTWPYYMCQLLAEKYPTHSVTYSQFDGTTKAYLAEVVMSTGSGTKSIDVFVASVSGASPDYFRASDIFPKAFAEPAGLNPDLVVIAHGLNINSVQIDEQKCHWRDLAIELIEAFPLAGFASIAQSPVRPDNPSYDNFKQKINGARDEASSLGMQIVDLFSRMDGNMVNADYSDSVHPTPTTQSVVMAPFIFGSLFGGDLTGNLANVQNVAYARRRSILQNGDLSAFSSTIPDGWAIANGTSSKELSIFETKSYSWKIVSAGGGDCQVYIALTAAQRAEITGKYATLAMRIFIPAAQGFANGPACNPQITTNNYVQYGGSHYLETGRWIWVTAKRRLISADSSATARFYLTFNPTPNTAGQIAYVDRYSLVVGNTPSDV